MEKTYWLGRKRAAMAMARNAACSRTRLIHYELAGRYSLKAAFAPFLLPKKGPATPGEKEALRLPPSSSVQSSAIIPRPPRIPRGRRPAGGPRA